MIFITIILFSIIIGYPIWDYFYMKKGDFSNKHKTYTTIMIPQWSLLGIFFIYWIATKRNWSHLFSIKPILHIETESLRSFGMGALSMVIFVAIFFIFSNKVKGKVGRWVQEQTDNIQFMLPTTINERLLFVLVAFTAGFCEEVIFRGVMLYELEHLPLYFSPVAMIVITGVLFGIVHFYQGIKGVIGTGYLGVILFYLYIATGNLWICIMIHFVIDVKFAFTPNKKVPLIEKNNDAQLINKQL